MHIEPSNCFQFLSVWGMSSCTDICRSILLKRLIPNSNVDYVDQNANFVQHQNYIFNLLKSTVCDGENNSALIIGPRGSGKTTVRSRASRNIWNDWTNLVYLQYVSSYWTLPLLNWRSLTTFQRMWSLSNCMDFSKLMTVLQLRKFHASFL